MTRIVTYAAIGLILLALAGLGLALALNRPSKRPVSPPAPPKSSREHFKPVGVHQAVPTRALAAEGDQPGLGSSWPAS